MDNLDLAREKILELCSEDDYGVWELFGAVAPFFGNEAKTKFSDLVQNLVKEQEIFPKLKSKATSELERAAFDSRKFTEQLENLEQPNPDLFYWFGTEGKS